MQKLNMIFLVVRTKTCIDNELVSVYLERMFLKYRLGVKFCMICLEKYMLSRVVGFWFKFKFEVELFSKNQISS